MWRRSRNCATPEPRRFFARRRSGTKKRPSESTIEPPCGGLRRSCGGPPVVQPPHLQLVVSTVETAVLRRLSCGGGLRRSCGFPSKPLISLGCGGLRRWCGAVSPYPYSPSESARGAPLGPFAPIISLLAGLSLPVPLQWGAPAAGRRLAPKRIYKPRLGLNDISVLSKSCYRRSHNCDKAVIWRMSGEVMGKCADTRLPVITALAIVNSTQSRAKLFNSAS